MAVAERLVLLRDLRNSLAYNLTAMGVSASDTETLETLVPKVLQILNSSAEVFTASLAPAWDVSYGFFSTGEVVTIGEVITIAQATRINKLTLVISGEGVSVLSVASPGWEISRAGNTITAVYAPGRVVPMEEMEAVLDSFLVTGDDVTFVAADVTLSAESVGGTNFQATGTASFSYAYSMTWRMLEQVYPTWQELNGKTWSEVQVFHKP